MSSSALILSCLIFSGCTQPVGVDSGTSELQSQADKLSFAYDANIDQVAFMSCNRMGSGAVTYNKSAYFTFRVGAYRNGGLALRTSFFEETKKKSAEKMTELLSMSSINSSTVMQIALRYDSNLQSVLGTTSGGAVENVDYMNLLYSPEPLGSLSTSQLLINLRAGERLKYVRNGVTIGGGRMEGSLYFMDAPARTTEIMNHLSNVGPLALTYTHGGSGTNANVIARSPGDVTDSTLDTSRYVYGLGYKMTFGLPSVSPLYSNYPRAVLKGVTESNLEVPSSSTGGTWTCPTELQFRVVRDEDITANKTSVNCRRMPDLVETSTDTAERANLIRLQDYARKSLYVEDWYMDVENRCIVAKDRSTTGCYGSDAQNVIYSMGDACDPNDKTKLCVSFASVCYRQQ